MSFIQCNFQSKALGMNTEINVIIPEKLRGIKSESGFPVLYLLHGLSDNNSAWCRFTSIERYAETKGLVVVMPWGGKSFYSDMKYGDDVFTFMTEELPQFCEQMFPISSKREDRFVAGLSMGGYGAFKLALSKPNMYAAAASLSGALDIKAAVENLTGTDIYTPTIPLSIYGVERTPSPTQDDLFVITENLVRNKVTLPALYMICGTEDFLYQDNRKFAKHIEELGIDAKVRWEPGTHEWSFWDKYIQDVLDWLPTK